MISLYFLHHKKTPPAVLQRCDMFFAKWCW